MSLRVVEQRAGSVPELGVSEDRRVAAAQAPGVEERCPVDVRHELGDVDVVERSRPVKVGATTVESSNVNRPAFARASSIDTRLRSTSARSCASITRVYSVLELGEERVALVVGEQLGDHARGAAGVGNVHDRRRSGRPV